MLVRKWLKHFLRYTPFIIRNNWITLVERLSVPNLVLFFVVFYKLKYDELNNFSESFFIYKQFHIHIIKFQTLIDII